MISNLRLHQAMLFTIATDNITGLNQLFTIGDLKQRAHANKNEALRTAIDHASLDAVKVLLDLPNVRKHARNLDKSAREALKALLQSEHTPDYAQDALSVQHNALRFQGTKMNSSYFTCEKSNQQGYAILNHRSRYRI